MKQYIERQKVIDLLYFFCDEVCSSVVSDVEKIESADVAPVVHGKWCVSEYEYLNCSVCGEQMYTGCNSTKEAIILAKHWKNYCPNCGAKMDLYEND